MNGMLDIDGTVNDLDSAASLLAGHKYQVSVYQNGDKEELQSMRDDLWVTDVIPSCAKRWQGYRELSQYFEGGYTPFILMRHENDADIAEEAFAAGAVDCFVLPYPQKEFVTRVRRDLFFFKQHIALVKKNQILKNQLDEQEHAWETVLRVQEKLEKKYEKKIMGNIMGRVLPLVQTLRESLTAPRQKECLDSITISISEILSDFPMKLINTGIDLTETETQVAVLIREGKTTKQIAHLLCVADNTVTFHRQNLRQKLGLTGKREGLRAVLQSIC